MAAAFPAAGAEARQQTFEVPPACARFGELQRSPGDIAGVGKTAGGLQRFSQQVEHPGRLGRATRGQQGIGASGQRRFVAGSQPQGTLKGHQRVVGAIQPEQDAAGAGVRYRPLGGERGRLRVGAQRAVEVPPNSRDVSQPEGVLVALVQGLVAHGLARLSASQPFCTWSRFSDCSKIRLRGPSITSEVISSPR